MSDNIVLLNVKRTGEVDEIKMEKRAFNVKRSVIAKHNEDHALLLFHGKSVSDVVRSVANEKIKEINASLGFSYQILEVEENQRIEYIDKLLTGEAIVPSKVKKVSESQPQKIEQSKKSVKKTTKKKSKKKKKKVEITYDFTTLPRVMLPSNLRTQQRSMIRNQTDNGPMIEEFQIAYYDNDPHDMIMQLVGGITEDTELMAIAKHLRVINEVISLNDTREIANQKLQHSISELVNSLLI